LIGLFTLAVVAYPVSIVAGIQSLSGGDDGQSGQLNEAARSNRSLADDLDRRTDR